MTYGNSGRIFKRNGKFNIGRNNCGLRPLFDNINLDYIKYIAEPIFKENVKGEKQKSLPQTIVKNLSIKIPIKNNKIDLQTQKEIAEKFLLVEDLKTKIKEYKNYIKNLNISIDSDFKNFKTVAISDIFTTKKGLSKYTKGYGNNNKGKYPVYSASNNAPLTYINSYDYDGKYLTWATNGFAGYIKVIDGKFSVNGDRGVLIPKSDDIDILFIKFILEPQLRKLAKGRKGDGGKDEFTKVYPSMVENVTVTLPILKDGSYDLHTQKEIANKYKKIEDIKRSIQEELLKIENIKIEIL